MHKFTPESVDKYLTEETLKSININLNDSWNYPSEKEFINSTNEEKELANNILSTISNIIDNNELPNTKKSRI